MDQKLLAFAAIITAAAMTGIFSTAQMAAYASDGDSSETNTDQNLNQKNTGSGDSANFNCGENLIDSTVSVICLAEPPPPPPPETATLSVCKEVDAPALLFIDPEDFDFTVTGNNPSPAQFEGSADCVDVTIGPGEYEVIETQTVVIPGTSTSILIQGDCEQDPNNIRRATGEIQGGETQECRFFNTISID